MLKVRNGVALPRPEARLRFRWQHTLLTTVTTFTRKQPLGLVGGAILLGIVVLALLAPGCSPGPQKAAAVDAEQARQALGTALDAWKAGKKPGDLKSGSPPITVQDLDWEGGAKLTSYELAGEGTLDNANLRIPVVLMIAGGQPKEVSYVVGTSPSITVFRELFQ